MSYYPSIEYINVTELGGHMKIILIVLQLEPGFDIDSKELLRVLSYLRVLRCVPLKTCKLPTLPSPPSPM